MADTTPEDSSPVDAGEEDTSTAPSDVLIDDTFTRPPIDAGGEGDTAADASVEDVSAEDTSPTPRTRRPMTRALRTWPGRPGPARYGPGGLRDR